MKYLIAYFLLLIIGPMVGAIGSIFLIPISIALGRFVSPFIAGQVVGVGQSYATAWFGKIFMGWFGITAGWLMVLVLGVGFFLNDLNRIASRKNTSMEFGYLFGDITGLIIAGYTLL